MAWGKRETVQRTGRRIGWRTGTQAYMTPPRRATPTLLKQPAPWGGEMGLCAACLQAPPADDEAFQT
jgi:hypothetical protein